MKDEEEFETLRSKRQRTKQEYQASEGPERNPRRLATLRYGMQSWTDEL